MLSAGFSLFPPSSKSRGCQEAPRQESRRPGRGGGRSAGSLSSPCGRCVRPPFPNEGWAGAAAAAAARRRLVPAPRGLRLAASLPPGTRSRCRPSRAAALGASRLRTPAPSSHPASAAGPCASRCRSPAAPTRRQGGGTKDPPKLRSHRDLVMGERESLEDTSSDTPQIPGSGGTSKTPADTDP
ncbi:hypothetical protein VULLAG_LOCUS20129 [Vulpes lagopus]